MDHPRSVRGGDRLAYLQEDGQQARQVGRAVLTVGQDLLERLAGEQLHHDKGLAACGQVELMDRDDAGMLQLAREAGLAEKPPQPHGPALLHTIHDLDGHAPLELGIPALEDDAHAASTDFPAHEVAMAGGFSIWASRPASLAGGLITPPVEQVPEAVADPHIPQGHPAPLGLVVEKGDEVLVHALSVRLVFRHRDGQVVVHAVQSPGFADRLQ